MTKQKLNNPVIRHPNYLWIHRKKMGYSQKTVALLLGHKTTSHVSDYERGCRMPSLKTAMKLEIILRIPVAYIYGEQYNDLKRSIRQIEYHIENLSDEA